MTYSDSYEPRRSSPPAAARRAQQAARARRDRLTQRRRRRLLPLVLGILLVTLFSALFTAFFGSGDPASGATTSTSPDNGQATAASTAAGAGAGQATIDPVARARSVQANEMGQVLVLMYHLIGHDDSQYNRTPEEFRQDIAALEAAGYYPVNLCDFANGDIDVPAGKSPVVITFDDSSGGQYRITADGRLDPDCAVAIMQAAVEAGGWASRASFYPLIDVDAPDHVLFGQPDLAGRKLRQLVDWGYEVGSHTVSHLNLKKASAAEAQKQLYQSKTTLEEMIGGGYVVTTLAAPFGEYPSQASILKSGEYEGQTYTYQAALKAMGGASLSPFCDGFRAFHIPRLQVCGSSLADALAVFQRSPGLRYVSDGDPDTISVPETLDPALGTLRAGLGQEVVSY